ncbi:uncharacterized protein V6R79_018330 [Siganus canaliculatus]
MDVQLAICCSPVALARKPSRNHTGRTAFLNARAQDSSHIPWELLGTSQTQSFRCSQWDFQKTSSTGAMTPCSAFVGVQNETASGSSHSMGKSSAKDHYSSSSPAKSSGCSTRLQTGSPLPDCVIGGQSTRPEETYWHSTAAAVSCYLRSTLNNGMDGFCRKHLVT